jgi:hypothetical protein
MKAVFALLILAVAAQALPSLPSIRSLRRGAAFDKLKNMTDDEMVEDFLVSLFNNHLCCIDLKPMNKTKFSSISID